MAMLVISTQMYENYGAHAWNGEGECPQYWKAKGGNDHKVLNIDVNSDLEKIVEAAKVYFSITTNEYYREYILDWSVEADDFLSHDEKMQLEYDGEIAYPESSIEYSELMLSKAAA